MILKTEAGTSYYQFENLASCRRIEHRIYTRLGGFSRPPYDGLNISAGIGDEAESVSKNREIISRSLKAGELVFARQTHGDAVAVLSRNKRGRSNPPNTGPRTADALVTDDDQQHLVIQVADCQPVLLYDPVRQVVANVHSGWRGSILNIIGRTLTVMQAYFKCHPSRIQAGIGPSLGPCCAEFVNYRDELPRTFWSYKDGNDHFDFWAISRDQLVSAGVSETNIEMSRICTRCRSDEFFSYRAENNTGRFAAVIGLKK